VSADHGPSHGRRWAAILWWGALTAIAVAGLVGRTWRLDFDERQHQHPDERFWALVASDLAAAETAPDAPADHGTFIGPVLDWLDADRSPANPYRVTESFVYGPAPVAWSRALAGWLHDGVASGAQPARAVAEVIDALGVPLIDDNGAPRFDDVYQVDLIGRLLSAVLDTATIVTVGLLGRAVGRRVGDRGSPIGLLAAALYSGTPVAIQHAHFMSSESALTLACALALLAAVELDRSASARCAAWHGARLGLACGAVIAVKLSGVALAAVPLAGTAALVWRHRRRADVVRLGSALLGAAIAFRLLHPAAFDGLGVWPSSNFRGDLDRIRHQYAGDTPPSYQWAGRTGPGQAAWWLWRFTFGPGLCLAAVAGVLVTVRRWRHGGPRWPAAIAVAGALVPGAYVIVAAVPTARYFLPALPATCVLAGIGVVAAWRVAGRLEHRQVRSPLRLAACGLVGVNLLWGVMYVRGVYGPDYTRVEATEWIVDNMPPGSVLTSQAWDDALPLALPGVDLANYSGERLNLVGTDSVDKLVALVRQLGRVDYVVEASPRLWGTVELIPARFGSTIRFFDALDTGTLGFERVATFDRDPRLGPLRLDDGGAEEQFAVLDHPEVRIWRKVRDVPPAEMIDVLDPVAAANALDVTATLSGSGGLLLNDDEAAALADGPTWQATFAGGPGWLHALAWLALFQLLAFAAFVMLRPLFDGLPDAGWGISKLFGLAGPASALFVASAWGPAPLTRPVIVAVVATFVGVGAWCGWRQRRAILRCIGERRRTIVAVEAMVVLAFGGALALRAANPDLWHPNRSGEKPFELAVFTALLRSDGLPPYDAWFSGGVLNYYYGGYLLLLAPARVLATAPGFALNVGVAVFAGAAAGAAASAGALLTAGWRAARQHGRRSWAGAIAGATALATVNVAVAREAWRHWNNGAVFDWWSVSRLVPGTTDINEFPAWTFLFGDLHPHLMSTGLVLTLLVTLAVAFRTLTGPGGLVGVAAVGLVVGMLIGLVRATNTWDFPLALAGTSAALLGPRLVGARWRRCAVAGGAAAFAAFVVWRPYTTRGQVFDQGFQAALTHTPWNSWALQWGWFAAVAVILAGPAWVAALRHSNTTPLPFGRAAPTGVVVTVGLAITAAGCLLVWPWAWVLVTTLALAAACAWAAWCRRSEPSALALAALAVGWTIQSGVELVTVRNDIGRQNTVFKFWYESWLLLAVGSAALLVTMIVRGRRRQRWLGGGAVASGVALALMFWALAVPPRVGDRVSAGGWSLDGERYLTAPGPGAVTAYAGTGIAPAEDLRLIEWIRGNLAGGPVVAEAAGDDYQWTSRVAWLTGLPTPVGWRFHESQQRRAFGPTVDRRYTDLKLLYTTRNRAEMARVLATYRVGYVVVGTVERALDTPESAAALRRFECLDIVFADGPSYVAEVDGECAYRLWRAALVAEINRGE
jgi:YYY domain-containing protein